METNLITDPNYVLDDKGKAHYLFDRKGANGERTKEFRTHHKNVGEDKDKPTASKPPKEPKPVKEPKEPKPPKAPKVPKVPKEPKTSVAASRNKRKRRGYDSDNSSDISEFDCDDSGSYMAKWSTTKRTRTRATAAALGSSSARGSDEGQEDDDDDEDDDLDAMNPLPGFIDPITLEVVVKPAISKYGHVMGYDSWIRCLLQEGATKNTCPLTKKPLTKRDLTILTFENIDEYR